MTQKQHYIQIYEPYDYNGPNPARAIGLGFVDAPEGGRHYLVALEKPVMNGTGLIEQLVLKTRYQGDAPERMIDGNCTVTISRVKPNVSIDVTNGYSYDDVQFWGAGKISAPPKNQQWG